MGLSNIRNKIFKRGSITYYYSSLFFPKEIKKKVFALYAFVRIVDDLVDSVPQKQKEFYKFWQDYKMKNKDPIMVGMRELNLKKTWVEAFFRSMEMDLKKKTYKNYAELKKYMYGSANVIGLMMAKLMNLPEKAYKYAEKLGESMQYINFLRDVMEDENLGRKYLPETGEGFIRREIGRYLKLQKEAEKGYKYIPKRMLVAVKTAADMYRWTAMEIYKNPKIIWQKKLKPSPLRVIYGGLSNAVGVFFI